MFSQQISPSFAKSMDEEDDPIGNEGHDEGENDAYNYTEPPPKARAYPRAQHFREVPSFVQRMTLCI